MNETTVESLREALEQSPNNIPLRFLLADTLLSLDRLKEAGSEYSTLIGTSNGTRAKIGLATVFLKQGRHSACNVVLEEVIGNGTKETSVYTLYAKGLLREGAMNRAMDAYRKALEIDPDHFDEELDNGLRQKAGPGTGETEEETDDRFLRGPKVDFGDVGGMEAVKKEIDLKIIKPLAHPELYRAYGKKTGGGILLYGPPGCGKTFIARATAGEANAKFMSVGLHDILDMWIGNSEKNLHEVFELARNNTPCILFIDEIDALGASRNDMKQSNGRHLINQFLQELDGIDNVNEGILVIGATNTPWNMDPAFRRPGRFDRVIFVPPPDERARESILRLKLQNRPTDTIDLRAIAKRTENFSGADIGAIVDIAVENKLESSFTDGIPRPLVTSDLLAALKKHVPSTQEWFSTAKNFAMFANGSGVYNDILAYMKIKR